MICWTAAFLVKDPLSKELVGLKEYIFDRWVRLGSTWTPESDFVAFVFVQNEKYKDISIEVLQSMKKIKFATQLLNEVGR